VEDEEIDETPGYVPPAVKSLKEIEELDQDDESLVMYKKKLLGEAAALDVDPSVPNVVVEKFIIMFKDESHPQVVLDLVGDISKLKETKTVIKEGTEYRLKIVFKVNREIVAGLRYFQATYRKSVRVDTGSLMVGSYGPKQEPQEFITPYEEAPKGMLARGSYTMKSRFTDDDKNDILTWEWCIDIKKDWK